MTSLHTIRIIVELAVVHIMRFLVVVVDLHRKCAGGGVQIETTLEVVAVVAARARFCAALLRLMQRALFPRVRAC